MRSITRSITAVVFALLVMAAGSTAALAANGAETGRSETHEAWCFDDVVLQYCFEVDGTFRYVATPNGREVVHMNFRNQTTVYENGVVVGSSDVRSIDKTVYVDGGQYATQSIVRTKASFGDQVCTSTTVFKMVDYEIVVDRSNGPGCIG